MSLEISGKRFKVEDIERPAIVGWGRYYPSRYITNQEFIARYGLDITAEQIEKSTGIVTRGEEPPGPTSSMEIPALLNAAKKAGISVSNLDLILENTSTPDRLVPGNASIIKRATGAKKAFASSHNDTCIGSAVLLKTACNAVRLGEATNVGIVTGEKYSAITNPEDIKQQIFFTWGGSALIVSSVRLPKREIRLLNPEFYFSSDASTSEDIIYIKAGGSADPLTEESFNNNEHKLSMNGRRSLLQGIESIPRNVREVLKKADLKIKDIDIFLPQGNLMVAEKSAKELKIPSWKVYTTIQYEGYVGCASQFLAMVDAEAKGILKPGMIACGAIAPDSGGNSGAYLIEWDGLIRPQKPWWRKAKVLARLAVRAFNRNYFIIPKLP